MENQQQKPTVADQVVDMMAGAGIKHMYAITGDSLNAVTDAIRRDGRIKFIHMRHEESAAFAADAEAQLTRSLACCAGSSGPGHVHLINGLYDAQRSDAPVLAIASTCLSTMFGTGYFQETDPTLLFSNCNVYNRTAVTPTQVPFMLHEAMQAAVSRKGVGIFGLPGDTAGMDAVTNNASVYPSVTERLPQASEEELDRVASILNTAKTVAVFGGSGAALAESELMELAAKLNAPVATTFKSQLELTHNCPNYVGHFGYLGMWSAIQAVAEADATLIIGTNFPFPDFFPADKKLIQVDIRAERLGKKARLTEGIRADSKSFLQALLPRLAQKEDRSFLDAALANYALIEKKMQEPVDNPGSKDAVRPEFVFSKLNELADPDAVFTVDTGMNCVWASHYLKASSGRSMIGSFMHGSMANAMPQSIGAQVAFPDRQVISLSGDGGLTMLMGDLLTIIQYQLPVKILVADNRSLAYVKWEMELAGLQPSQVNLTNPDFADMARAIGFQAETVHTPEDLEGAMKRWLSAKGPALLSVVTDTNAASFTFDREMMEGAKPTSLTTNFLPLGSV